MGCGFFAKSLLVGKPPPSLLPQCGSCGLFKHCQSPKMPYSGNGKLGILICGEAPGSFEDEKNLQFVGKAGQRLQAVLASLGVDMREDCWLTDSLICHPENNRIKDQRMIDYCRPNFMRTIAELQPKVVILLGDSPVRSLIGEVWKDNPGPISRWVGFKIPSHKLNAWICPTYHPSYLLREDNEVLNSYFEKHLRAAIRKAGSRPWEVVPDWEKQVEVILDSDEAAKRIDDIEARGGQIAFDYENNCIKPETRNGQILCASLSWEGKETFAYPWHGLAIASTQRLLHSDRCGFISSNLKHEDRWTRHEFGQGVRHWIWDTMLAAHTIDNRKGICSLKFQAYVNLGMPSYDDAIRQFLRATKEKQTNSAKEEIDLRQLLQYCGVDSLLEYKLAEFQCGVLKRRNEN